MPKFRFDALEKQDAALSAFVSRELEFVRPQAFEVKFAARKGRILMPVNNAIDTGAEIYTYDVKERVGKAKFVRDFSKDFPRVDHKIGEVSQKLHSIGDSYGWSMQELRAAKFARRRLTAQRAKDARETIEDTIDEILLLGNVEWDLEGLFNFSGTLIYTIPVGAGGSTFWENKTPDEIVEDVGGAIQKMLVDTKEIERPNTLVLPTSSMAEISRRRMGDGTSQTIKSYLMNILKDQGITRIESSILLETAGAGGKKRKAIYNRNNGKLEGLIPQEFEQFPPQFDGLEVSTYCHARIGGGALYYPKSIIYADGI